MKTLSIRPYRKVDEMRRHEIIEAIQKWGTMLLVCLLASIAIANCPAPNPENNNQTQRRPY